MISIIIPCYNIGSYIEKTLDSVFAQEYSNIEVIAVDDGSKDNTGAVLDEYSEKEPRLRVIHKENGGVTRARLTGVEAANGKYIGFVDGDDLIDSDMYSRLYSNIRQYNADISHCGYRMLENGSETFFYNTGKIVEQDRSNGLCDLLNGTFVEPGLWNKLFRRELFVCLLNENKMDFTVRENEDLLMNYYLFNASLCSVYEDFCPYVYLIRDTSCSHGGVKLHILNDPVHVGEILLSETKNNESVYKAAAGYYVTKLIKVATFDCAGNPAFIVDARDPARKKLRGFVKEYLTLCNNPKRKILAFMAAYCPNLYCRLHKIYNHAL